MKNYKYVLFDLDGTLVDSSEGIVKGFAYALSFFGIEVKNKKELEIFIGPPLKDSFINHYNLTENEANVAIEKYREYYSKYGARENKLYDGIQELLKSIKENGKIISTATSKPEIYTIKILEQHNIKKYFDFVSGATLDGSRLRKAEVIKHAIKSLNIENLDECIIIGDRCFDIQGAKQIGIDSIGVTYGFGAKEELENAGATYIVENVDEINEILINSKK